MRSVQLHSLYFGSYDSISGPCITSSPSSLSTPAKRPLSLLRVSTHSRTLGVGKTTRQRQIVEKDREIFEEEMVKTVWVSSNRSHLRIITAFHGRLVMSHAMCAWGGKDKLRASVATLHQTSGLDLLCFSAGPKSRLQIVRFLQAS